MRKLILLVFLLALTIVTGQANAKWQPPRFELPKVPTGTKIVSLGETLDKSSGKKVTGYMFIHYKNKSAQLPLLKFSRKVPCYGFLATGAKWKTVEPWIVNPANTRGVSGDFIFQNLSKDINKWEDAADGKLDSSTSFNILGNGSVSNDLLTASTNTPDNKNVVYFAKIDDPGVIAVTTIWGYFGGRTAKRELLEWDQVYNDYDFDWSMSGETAKMDFENIATHELGHSVGLNDQYNSACQTVTMYGYASNGEVQKQSLEVQDIAGVSTLY